MRWGDERYVRLYKRDTADWLALSFDAQALFCLLLRKVDLSGRLELGRHGPKAIAMVLGQVALWESRLKAALDELLADGCVALEGVTQRDGGITGGTLVIPNYVEAQEAKASDKLRAKMYRERKEVDSVTYRDADNTQSDSSVTAASRTVTQRHAASLQPSPPSPPSQPIQPDQKPLAQSPAAQAPAPAAPVGEFQTYVAAEWPDVKDLAGFEKRAQAAFPGVDLLAEARKARGWELSDPRRRKVQHGKFLFGWFSRAQDNASRGASAPGLGVPRPQPAGAAQLRIDTQAHAVPGRKILGGT